jgi:hypothetical protein
MLVHGLWVAQNQIPADVDVVAFVAHVAHHVGDYHHQTRLHTSDHFVRELFDMDAPEKVSLKS